VAAKDRYDIEVQCSKCGTQGLLNVSENDYPFMRKLDRQVRSADSDFDIKMLDDSDFDLTCKNCSEKFPLTPQK